MTRTRFYMVVKLEGDDDSDACAATTREDATALLGADPESPEGNRRLLSQRVRATDAGAARLKTDGPWIYGMLLRHYL